VPVGRMELRREKQVDARVLFLDCDSPRDGNARLKNKNGKHIDQLQSIYICIHMQIYLYIYMCIHTYILRYEYIYYQIWLLDGNLPRNRDARL